MYFEIYRDTSGHWRWRAKAVNHVIIADSAEGYVNKADCLHGINIIKNEAAMAQVIEI